MKTLVSHKPSGTYLKMMLIQRYRFRPDQEERPVGWKFVANDALADLLAGRCIAAVLFDNSDNRRLIVPVGA